MNIAVAQSRPIKGDIEANIEEHIKLIEVAISKNAEVIIFPELSLTGYEPEIMHELAISIDDECLDVFQVLSDAYNLLIAVGCPVKEKEGVSINLLVFRPEVEIYQYSKKYLHEDELKYFVSRESKSVLKFNNKKLGLAICYELTIPEHSETTCAQGADVYLASVAKSEKGAKRSHGILSEIAKKQNIPVIMSNFVGEGEGFICGGQSAAWDKSGAVAMMLDEKESGILVYEF